MGGLVASRYVLRHPNDHHVNKMISVSTPWLGAPKALAILEAGGPFVSEWIADSGDIKKISEFFPAVHQLIPGPAYFRLGGRPFAEDRWDYDNNGVAFEQYNQYSKLVNGLNVQHPHPASLPGNASSAFRTTPGQEDASGDQSGIDYYSIYSNQKKIDTVGKVISIYRRPSLRERAENRLGLTIFPLKDVSLEHTEGDGTVPLLSLRRATMNSNGTPLDNLNPGWNDRPDDSRYFLIKPGPTDSDKIAEHVAVTGYPPVQDLILYILRDLPISLPGNQNQAQNQESSTNPALAQIDDGAPLDPLPAYYLTVRNVSDLRITDAYGNTDSPLGPFGLRNVSNVNISVTNPSSATMVMPTDQRFTVVATTKSIPMSLEIVKAKGQTATTLAVRYNDVELAANVKVMLSVGPQGVEALRSRQRQQRQLRNYSDADRKSDRSGSGRSVCT